MDPLVSPCINLCVVVCVFHFLFPETLILMDGGFVSCSVPTLVLCRRFSLKVDVGVSLRVRLPLRYVLYNAAVCYAMCIFVCISPLGLS